VLLYACTRRVLVFSDNPPAPEDMGAESFGVFNWSSTCSGMLTTIEGGLGIPVRGHKRNGMLSTLHTSRMATIPSSPPQDERSATPIAGVIMTKTTIEITSRPVTQDGDPDQGPLTGGSSEPGRYPSWAGSRHKDADAMSWREVCRRSA
jgi:hypothetical protein